MLACERSTPDSFKDLRSLAKPAQREKIQRQKYHNYRLVNPGQVSQPHYVAPECFSWAWGPLYPADLSDCKVTTLTKRQLYDEAQLTAPRYLSNHISCCGRCDRWLIKDLERGIMAAKAEAQNWNKYGQHRDFAGAYGWDSATYDETDSLVRDWYDLGFCECGEYGYHDYCDFEPYGGYEDVEPQAVYDLGTLVDNALAGLRVSVKEPGWEDISGACVDSPEMAWVQDVAEFSESEEFEWL